MKKLATVAAAAVVVAASVASAQQRPTAAQAQPPAQAQTAAARTVGSLVASGFSIVSVIGHPTETKSLIVTLQKAGEAYFCPILAANPIAMSGACVKAL